MNKETLIKEFINAVEDMKETKYDGTYHWTLGRDENGNDWAIVLGWADGFEPNENDDCMDGTYSLCAKIAYQPYNSVMQCDYDVDWFMPYDEESGEVDETEISIFSGCDLEYVFDWLLNCYSSYAVDWTIKENIEWFWDNDSIVETETDIIKLWDAFKVWCMQNCKEIFENLEESFIEKVVDENYNNWIDNKF